MILDQPIKTPDFDLGYSLDQDVVVVIHGGDFLELRFFIVAKIEANIIECLVCPLVQLHFCGWKAIDELGSRAPNEVHEMESIIRELGRSRLTQLIA